MQKNCDAMQKYIGMMQDIRHDLHQNPELGFEENRTAKIIADKLKAMDIEVHTDFGGTGVVGVLRNGTGNRSILLRADMDALPITETSTHNYVSKNSGKMHACGHDGHMAMLLGCTQYLSTTKKFDGTVILLFQPDEEQGRGAQAMLDDGLIAKFSPDECYAIHNLPNLEIGHFATKVGDICASESMFEFTIKARGGHSAMPHLGVDAIVVGAELVNSIQTIVARKLAPKSGSVVSITEFITDGSRNILPTTAILKGDTRNFTPENCQKVEDLLQQVASGIAATHNVEITLDFKSEFVPTINSQEQVKATTDTLNNLGYGIDSNCEALSFSEDFGRISNVIPGCFVLMGNGMSGANAQPLHASDYDFNDDALPYGSSFFSKLAEDRLPIKK